MRPTLAYTNSADIVNEVEVEVKTQQQHEGEHIIIDCRTLNTGYPQQAYLAPNRAMRCRQGQPQFNVQCDAMHSVSLYGLVKLAKDNFHHNYANCHSP